MASNHKMKIRVRDTILNALAFGTKGGNQFRKGAIFKLLEKLEWLLDSDSVLDSETLLKITTAYLKLSALAMPNAAQEEAIKAGINPIQNDPKLLMDMMTAFLQERRALLNQHIPIEVTGTVIDSAKTVPNRLLELAKQELSQRSGTSIALTPPP